MCRVTLRDKPISKGRKTLFLDIYPPVRNPDTGRLQRKYYLKIFLFSSPKSELERLHNKETKELAYNEAAKRQLDVQNQQFGFLSVRMRKGNFVEFFVAEMDKRKKMSSRPNWESAIRYFVQFAGEKVLFSELNETFSEEFADYLLSKPSLGPTKRKIGTNSAVSYFAKYRFTIYQAYKSGYLTRNLYDLVEPISSKASHREFLFLYELQALAKTPCISDVIKRGGLFSALTGLRFSDVHTLRWDEIRGSKGNYYIQFFIDKTGQAEFHPISDEAYLLLGEPGEGEVFKGLDYRDVVSILPGWLMAAGIKRRFTFHCFRHTFATLQLISGTEIPTVSKLLGHKNIQTTMIYVHIVDALKRQASHRIELRVGDAWLKKTIT
ncbi:MAG: site-specific integrase [Candidatus Pseudobacter hemicellulosilyticus]|uniref:Site-specific integrase n=1 Tax=Candidatus Pseudobacter hemicellulosilyticus TaxID=3121375 RepID=A0AAJ6BFZ0_9BACT|nr:MAG: site-specific integrase [Pseudobacter sp.]